MNRPRTALVLSAGGMFGAYQAGAWRYLAGRCRPDIVIGTSAGALNGWAIAGGCDPEELIRSWLDPSTASLAGLRWPLPPGRGILDGDCLHARIRELWLRFRPRTETGVVAVELRRLQPRLFRNEEIGWEHLAASCALLLCYPQVRIDGRLYTDGGLLGALPLWAAAEMGATHVVAINVLPQPLSKTVRAFVRAIRVFARRPAPLPEDVKVLSIAPRNALGHLRDSVFWRPRAVREWIDQGYRDAEAAGDSLRSFLRPSG